MLPGQAAASLDFGLEKIVNQRAQMCVPFHTAGNTHVTFKSPGTSLTDVCNDGYHDISVINLIFWWAFQS